MRSNMRNSKSWIRLLAVLSAFGLLAAACGGDDAAEPEPAEAAEPDGMEAADPDDMDTDAPDGSMMMDVSLADVCPSPVVVQTSWFPESEHGVLFNLIGEGYVVDTGQKLVRGPMVLDGMDLGIELEIRAGGAAIGWSPVASYMYTDDSIHIGYAATDAQILQFAEAPLKSVMATVEKSPMMIMWDPETYPDINGIADLGREGVPINVFAGRIFQEVFVAQGIWSEDQLDPSYDGSPASFISAGGSLAQVGFATTAVYTYEHIYEDWGKPVAFELLHDAGFQIYLLTLGVRPDDIETLRPCLEKLVPVFQRSIISYDQSPESGNAVIVDAVEQYAASWVYPPDLAAYTSQTMRDLGLVGNGPDDTVGDMEADRIQKVLDDILSTPLADDVPEGLTIDDIFTNEFINPDIGF